LTETICRLPRASQRSARRSGAVPANEEDEEEEEAEVEEEIEVDERDEQVIINSIEIASDLFHQSASSLFGGDEPQQSEDIQEDENEQDELDEDVVDPLSAQDIDMPSPTLRPLEIDQADKPPPDTQATLVPSSSALPQSAQKVSSSKPLPSTLPEIHEDEQPQSPVKVPRRRKKATPSRTPYDAPARNTRSRSRSVEPSNLMPPPTMAPVKTLPPVTEDQEEELNEDENDDSMPGEEGDIESVLRMLDAPSVTSAQTSAGPGDATSTATETEATPRPVPIVPQSSLPRRRLSEDDRQTAQILRARSGSELVGLLKPRASMTPRATPAAPSIRGNSVAQTPRLNTGRATDNKTTPATVRASGRKRKNSMTSTTSEDTFPQKGTRAAKFKREMLEAEKKAPYTPPRESRAAQRVQSTITRSRTRR
jgi:hypothetical protein